MKLLIITQKVDKNDPILGFFHRWLEVFASECKQVVVICLQEGEHSLPENVSIYSLGKESSESRLKYLKNFYKCIFSLRNQYDAVFVHMNPIYVVLGGIFWHLLGKKVGLWYTHGYVSIKLQIAEKLSDIIFTASKESFRLKSSKVQVVGHGIDTDLFAPTKKPRENATFVIVTASRISPVKNINLLIDAIKVVQEKKGKGVSFHIYGKPQSRKEQQYFHKLKRHAKHRGLDDVVLFKGAVTNTQMPEILQDADVFVQASDTGSLDKAVLEAMATNTLAVTTNVAFCEIPGVNKTDRNMSAIANSIIDLEHKPGGRQYVEKNHSINRLVQTILRTYHHAI